MTSRELREQSESNQREREQSDFVIPSEPKILRLVRILIQYRKEAILKDVVQIK